jgi:protein O-mannosyl-transferase
MPIDKLTKSRLSALICFALGIITFILYLPVRHDAFTNFDDGGYIMENTHVTSGLRWSNIAWSFTHSYAGYWMPLTWISHMIDCQLFGLNAGEHHLVNVLFHIANTILLFWWLKELTGAPWRSAFVAALFSWHPLRVESVAWACERKDVLSAFFWFLTLIAYGRYVKVRASNNRPQARVNYVLALLMFACGLMSKPMVVTLPCVLLLLDFWPLERFSFPVSNSQIRNLAGLIIEKVPFFILAGIECAITCFAQTSVGVVSEQTFAFRLTKALWEYIRYISKIFCPVNLAVVYPFPTEAPIAPGILAACLLVTFSIIFIFALRKRPYLLVGWLWFLGTLVPVIGIAKTGEIFMADRYTYLPSIGIYILLTWGLAGSFESRRRKEFLAVAGAAALAVCLILTSIQIRYWRDSITLFRHALAVTTNNYIACASLAEALDAVGHDDEAEKYSEEAVQIEPKYASGQFYLGMILWKKGDVADAFYRLNYAIKEAPHVPGFQYNLGKFLLEQGLPDKAAEHFSAALDDDPDFAQAHNGLGKTLLKEGKLPQAADQLSQAVVLDPNNAQYHYDLGTVLLADSQPDRAIAEFSQAIRLQPDLADAEENLAVALAGQGKLSEAIAHFLKVVQLRPNDPEGWFNLGFAYLNNHQPANAATQFTQELRLAPNQSKAHYRLAQALEQENKPAEAASHYYEALRLTPNFPDAQKELDEILAAHPELR